MTVNKNHKGTALHIRLDFLVCLFLVLITLAVYQQVRNYEFVNYDDGVYITGNVEVQSGLTAANIRWALTDIHSGNWHPLTWLSHMLDIQLYGMRAGRHHLTNVLFHIINILLLFIVFRKMTGDLGQSSFVAALFALHPIHVESVAWVAERKNVLSTFFWMLTMWSYVRYIEQPEIKRYLLVILIFVLGLMSKPMLVTLPFVLLLLDFWPLCRFQFGRFDNIVSNLLRNPKVIRPVLEKIPLIVLAAASCVVTLRVERVYSFDLFPLQSRIANALVSYTGYIGKMIWPDNLACFYPYPHLLPAWKVAGAGLLLVFTSFLAFKSARRRPYFLVGWLWYLGTLVPVIGLVQVGPQAMADRYTYVPLIGLFVVIAWGVPHIVAGWRHKRVLLATSAGIVISAFIVCTWFQIGLWQNSITLFENAIKVTDDNWLAHYNLAGALSGAENYDQAIIHYKKVIDIKPDQEKVNYNLALAFASNNNFDEAAVYFRKALRISPEDPYVHNNLANMFFAQGKLDEAVLHYTKALQLNPEYADAHYNFGSLLMNRGRFKEALIHLAETIRITPDYAEAYHRIGFILAQQGKLQGARKFLKMAAQIDPNNMEARKDLEILNRKILPKY